MAGKAGRGAWRPLALLMGLAALPTAAGAAAPGLSPSPTPASGGQVAFTTPSNNIGCTYTPAGGTSVYRPRDGGPELLCERVAPDYVTVVMGRKGAVRRIDNPGEQGCCSLGQTLPYGQVWANGPFTCQSRKTGLICRRNDGRGFFLSQSGVRIF